MYEYVLKETDSVRSDLSDIQDQLENISVFAAALGDLSANFSVGGHVDRTIIFNDIRDKVDTVHSRLRKSTLELTEVVGSLGSMVVNSIKE